MNHKIIYLEKYFSNTSKNQITNIYYQKLKNTVNMTEITSELIPILSGIISAIISAIVSIMINRKLSSNDEKNKLEKEINGAKIVLNAEFKLNIKNLKRYKKRYLTHSIARISRDNENEDYVNFYKNLVSFPIFSHENWNNSKNIIEHLFTENQIQEIIEFNNQCDHLKEKSIKLQKKCDEIFEQNILSERYTKEQREAYRDILNFESEIDALINKGDIILIYIKNW